MEYQLKQKNKGAGSRPGSFFAPGVIQPKLTVNAPDDIYEKEADAVADKVMRMPIPQMQQPAKEDEKEKRLQKKANVYTTSSETNPNSGFSVQLKSNDGNGNRLPEGLQSEMGKKMGADFREVKVHSDSTSYNLNRQLRARAFTHGSDIYFNKGQYDPTSFQGKHLMAHELTHVMQQNSSTGNLIQRQSDLLEVDSEAGMEIATGGEAITHVGALGRIGARNVNYNTIVSTGKKIYSQPIANNSIKFRLKYNDIVELVGLTKSGWAFISSPSGQGWVQAQYVYYPLPDFKTELHFVQEDEMLKDVMVSYYGSKGVDVRKWGADVRLYVHATAMLNKNMAGIGYYDGKKENVAWYQRVLLDKTGEETQEIWNSIYLKTGHNIWLPSVDLIKSMQAQGAISGGSVSHSVVMAVLEGIAFNIGLSIGVLEGLWTALVDTLSGIVDLVVLVGDLIQKLFTGELADYLAELYEGMKEAIINLPDTLKKMWEEFMAMSPFDKGRAVGKIIGMILFEILLAFFTAGAVTAIKWAGKGGKLAKAFGKISKLKNKANKITKHVDTPDPKLKSKIDDGLKKKTRTLTPDQQKQADIVGDVESGTVKIENYGEKQGNYKRKGNYGEMKMDAHMEHNKALRDKGYDLERISSGRVTDIDQKIASGIDGVYENAKPPPKYIIAESKFGSSQLSPNPKDGPQMSDTWIAGSQRLEKAVGRAKAREILTEGYERVLVKVDSNGNVITKKIDSGGNVTTDWP